VSALALALVLLAQERALPTFEPAEPASVGIERAWLDALGGVVEGWVDEQRIVGAELLVIRDDRTVLHAGYGWRHREEEVPMTPGGVFCLRSMTKAVVGTAVQILIDEEKLAREDAVAKHMEAFDGEATRTITVGQLLTHTGGLTLSSLLGQDLASVKSEAGVAALTALRGPEFPPGSGFHYSDDGADTLGALVEEVSGTSLEAFLCARLFEPLGMHDMAGVMTLDHPLRARLCSAYGGGPGAWTRFFGPKDAPLFPFLLASQGLYGTALDYARFLHLWKEHGLAGRERLLSTDAVERALAPRNSVGMPTGFAGLEPRYGELMMLWVDPAKPDEPVAFGHGGSDGTMAWVFPALDLMVLYFTQSRNTTTLIEFEGALQRCLLDPLRGRTSVGPVAYGPDELAAFTGLFWEADDQEYQAALLREGALWLELPGKTVVELAPTAERDVFQFRLSPEYRIEFERGPEGAVIAFTGERRGVRERMPRIVASADLPDADELMARKKSACDWDAVAALGPVRVRSSFEMPAVKVSGTSVTLADGLERLRSVNEYGGLREELVLDGPRGWSTSPEGTEELSAARRGDLFAEHPLLVAADWRAAYRKLTVVARIERGGEPAYLVRAQPADGHAHTWIVAESGLPLAQLTIPVLPGMGEVGCTTEFGDWRPVGEGGESGGVRLPFERSGRYASRILGVFTARLDAVETHVELPEDAFSAGLSPGAR